MGYFLLWFESLTAVLLVAAALVALAARRPSRVGQFFAALVPSGVLLLVVGTVLWATWMAEFGFGVVRHWTLWVALWTSFLLVGIGWLLSAALRRTGEPAAPAGRDWSALRLTLAGGVAMLLFLSTFTIMDAGARAQVGALRGEAGALVLAAAPPRVADRDNAAFLYQEAFDALPKVDKESAVVYAKFAEWSQASKPLDLKDADLQRFLSDRAAGLDLLRQAAARPGCYFPRQYGRVDALMPELSDLRTAAVLLGLEARYRAAQGDTDRALANVAAMHEITRHVSAEPVLISYLVAVAVDGMARDTLGQVLRSQPVSAKDLAPLAQLEPVYFRPLLLRSLQMEQAFAFTMFTAVAEGDEHLLGLNNDGALAVVAVAPALWRLFFLADDVASYRELMRRVASAVEKPYPYPAEAWPVGMSVMDAPGLLTRQLMPAFGKVIPSAPRADASRRLVTLAVAVARYRDAKGEYPAKLDALMPEFLPFIPLDPYTGTPLKLAREGKGVVIYSVGPDGKDDGGKPMDYRKQPYLGDIVIPIGTDVPAEPKAEPLPAPQVLPESGRRDRC